MARRSSRRSHQSAGRQPVRRSPEPPSPFNRLQHAKKRAFLAAFAECGMVGEAAKIAGCSRVSHFLWARSDPVYAALFEEAKQLAITRLEDEATRRAVEGWDEPIYQGGQLVGYKRRYSDTLLIFRLNAELPEKYRQRQHIEHSITDQVQAVLAQWEPVPPERPALPERDLPPTLAEWEPVAADARGSPDEPAEPMEPREPAAPPASSTPPPPSDLPPPPAPPPSFRSGTGVDWREW